jgi:hypothetical protein
VSSLVTLGNVSISGPATTLSPLTSAVVRIAGDHVQLQAVTVSGFSVAPGSRAPIIELSGNASFAVCTFSDILGVYTLHIATNASASFAESTFNHQSIACSGRITGNATLVNSSAMFSDNAAFSSGHLRLTEGSQLSGNLSLSESAYIVLESTGAIAGAVLQMSADACVIALAGAALSDTDFAPAPGEPSARLQPVLGIPYGSVTLNHIDVRNFGSSTAPLVDVAGNTSTLSGCTFSGNQGVVSLHVAASGTAAMDNCLFLSNTGDSIVVEGTVSGSADIVDTATRFVEGSHLLNAVLSIQNCSVTGAVAVTQSQLMLVGTAQVHDASLLVGDGVSIELRAGAGMSAVSITGPGSRLAPLAQPMLSIPAGGVILSNVTVADLAFTPGSASAILEIDAGLPVQLLSCVFTNNTGAVVIRATNQSAATFSDCVFANNSAPVNGSVVEITLSSSAASQCRFLNNHGGAVSLTQSNSTFEACRFEGNILEAGDTSAARNIGGGAIHALNSQLVLDGCTLVGNIVNVPLANAGNGGGALFVKDEQHPSTTLLVNTTFVENAATVGSVLSAGGLNGGGAVCADIDSVGIVRNTLESGNRPDSGFTPGFPVVGSLSSLVVDGCSFFNNTASAQHDTPQVAYTVSGGALLVLPICNYQGSCPMMREAHKQGCLASTRCGWCWSSGNFGPMPATAFGTAPPTCGLWTPADSCSSGTLSFFEWIEAYLTTARSNAVADCYVCGARHGTWSPCAACCRDFYLSQTDSASHRARQDAAVEHTTAIRHGFSMETAEAVCGHQRRVHCVLCEENDQLGIDRAAALRSDARHQYA